MGGGVQFPVGADVEQVAGPVIKARRESISVLEETEGEEYQLAVKAHSNGMLRRRPEVWRPLPVQISQSFAVASQAPETKTF